MREKNEQRIKFRDSSAKSHRVHSKTKQKQIRIDVENDGGGGDGGRCGKEATCRRFIRIQ
jgi:hypothetical protein